MRILLIDNGTTLLKKLKQLVPGEEAVSCFDTFERQQAREYDLVVLSGSSVGPLYGNEERYREEVAFIQKAEMPVIGVCFGCELIVHACGGTLRELPEQELGEVRISVVQDSELFCGKDSFIAYENHRWGADVLPPELEVLAESEHGPEVIRHTSRPLYGLQFHPENHPERTFGDELFLNILLRVTTHV